MRRLLALAALAVFSLLPAAAHATYSGANGEKILFSRCPAIGDCSAYHLMTSGLDGSSVSPFLATTESNLDASYSKDGTRTVYSDCPTSTGSCVIATNNAAGTAPHPLKTATANVVDDYPVFSPDGSKIAFIRETGPNDYALMIMGADGSNPVPLTAHVIPSITNTEVSFSPDGSKIVFEDDSKGLSIIPTDGSGPPVALDQVGAGVEDQAPDWSPDGSTIVFTRTEDDANWQLNTIPATPGPAVTPTPLGGDPGADADDYEPSYSPDGKKILFERYVVSTGAEPIWVEDANGSNPKRVTAANQEDFRAVWAPRVPAQPGPPPPPPPPPATKPFAGVSLRGQTDTVTANGVTQVRVSCPAGTSGNCTGTLTLKTAGPVAAQTSKKHKKHTRVLTLGHAKFSIPAGKTAKVKVHISRTGMKLLRKRKRLSVRALVTSKAGTIAAKPRARRITLKLAKPHSHKKKHHK